MEVSHAKGDFFCERLMMIIMLSPHKVLQGQVSRCIGRFLNLEEAVGNFERHFLGGIITILCPSHRVGAAQHEHLFGSVIESLSNAGTGSIEGNDAMNG